MSIPPGLMPGGGGPPGALAPPGGAPGAGGPEGLLQILAGLQQSPEPDGADQMLTQATLSINGAYARIAQRSAKAAKLLMDANSRIQAARQALQEEASRPVAAPPGLGMPGMGGGGGMAGPMGGPMGGGM